MKKTPLSDLPAATPQALRRLLSGAQVYDCSCSPEARVYLIDKDAGYYLKTACRGTLENEAKMTAYFHEKGLAPEVLAYCADDCDWLVTAAASGEDATDARYLENPARLCDTIALELRRLHETDCTGCPIEDRTAAYFSAVERSYRAGRCDLAGLPESLGCRSADDAYAAVQEGKAVLGSCVLLHGDYCLPNIILKNWKLSCFIDLGYGGVGDRHIDLYWGLWTLAHNLKTDRYTARFLDAYGRDLVDAQALKIVACAEAFG